MKGVWLCSNITSFTKIGSQPASRPQVVNPCIKIIFSFPSWPSSENTSPIKPSLVPSKRTLPLLQIDLISFTSFGYTFIAKFRKDIPHGRVFFSAFKENFFYTLNWPTDFVLSFLLYFHGQTETEHAKQTANFVPFKLKAFKQLLSRLTEGRRSALLGKGDRDHQWGTPIPLPSF